MRVALFTTCLAEALAPRLPETIGKSERMRALGETWPILLLIMGIITYYPLFYQTGMALTDISSCCHHRRC